MASWTRCLVLALVLFIGSLRSDAKDSPKVYIVHVKGGSHGKRSSRTAHMEILEQVLDKGRKVSESLIYSYKESLTGFAARLTKKERKKLKGLDNVLAVERSKIFKPQTTRSWDFLGFPTNVERAQGDVESDLIVGVLDDGIWPNLDSFSDDGFGPPPGKWKGKCENITCNNKIIGARSYYTGNEPLDEDKSVIDVQGHGTHVASIAAGRQVGNANFFGLGRGIARGAVPSARIAVYKVCWKTVNDTSCLQQDIMAALDDAIQDGVDVLSLSLGKNKTSAYDVDSIAIGSFRAIKKNILTVAAAGNHGPKLFTVTNGAPWILTVGATTIDRRFIGEAVLGNGQSLYGPTVNAFPTQSSFYPLESALRIIGRENSNFGINNGGSILQSVTANVRDLNLIVFFRNYSYIDEANKLDPKGMLLYYGPCTFEAFTLPSPGICLAEDEDVENLRVYFQGYDNPTAKIIKSRGVFDPEAPVLADFSARGPNKVSPDLLKPDVCAPGVEILAAYSPVASPSALMPSDKRSTKFNIMSGTSMACPHVSGAALYVKAFHPSWSPAAIKSALMTTATPMYPKDAFPKDDPLAELGYGAGQINPVRAIDPGLVYEATEGDYVNFLCSEGYSIQSIEQITGDNNVTCSGAGNFTAKSLNYPSMSAKVAPNQRFTVEFNRTATNIGSNSSVYNAETEEPITGLRVDVDPSVLDFTTTSGTKLGFHVTVTGEPLANETAVSASLVWRDEKHSVRSPIVIYAL